MSHRHMNILPTQRSHSRRARGNSHSDLLYRVSRQLAMRPSRQISIGPHQIRMDYWSVNRANNASIEQIQSDATAWTLFQRGYTEGRKSIRRRNRSRFLNSVTPAARRGTLPQRLESRRSRQPRRFLPIERQQHVPIVQVPENVIVSEDDGVAVELVEDLALNYSNNDDIGHLQPELEPMKGVREEPKEMEMINTTEDFKSVTVEGTMEVSIEKTTEMKISADVPEGILESEKRMVANDVKNIVDVGQVY